MRALLRRRVVLTCARSCSASWSVSPSPRRRPPPSRRRSRSPRPPARSPSRSPPRAPAASWSRRRAGRRTARARRRSSRSRTARAGRSRTPSCSTRHPAPARPSTCSCGAARTSRSAATSSCVACTPTAGSTTCGRSAPRRRTARSPARTKRTYVVWPEGNGAAHRQPPGRRHPVEAARGAPRASRPRFVDIAIDRRDRLVAVVSSAALRVADRIDHAARDGARASGLPRRPRARRASP